MEIYMENNRLIKLDSQFEYIKSNIQSNGAILDSLLESSLDFQYHYSSFIFSSLCYDGDDWEKVLSYLENIKPEQKKISEEFNNFFILLSFYFFKKDKLKPYINKIKFRSEADLGKLNNNFTALNILNKLLLSKVKGVDLKIDFNFFSTIQFDDGFFPDTNFNLKKNKNTGIPHLVYHAKILMCLGLVYLLDDKNNKKLFNSFIKGFNALNDISTEKESTFYGRSNNSLFGKSCVQLVYVIHSIITGDNMSLLKSKNIFINIFKNQYINGYVPLNSNKYTKIRPGYDRYMYDIVYNTYSNAILLLANKLSHLNKNKNKNKNDKLYEENITKFFHDSGFVLHRHNKSKLVLNYKGHQNYTKYLFDSRLSALSINYLEINNINVLPGMVFPIQPITSLVEKKHYLRKVLSIWNHLINYNYLPILSGNTIIIEDKNVKYYPFQYIDNKYDVIKFKAISRLFFSKKQKFKTFDVKLIFLKNQLNQIFVLQKQQIIYYSIRTKFDYYIINDYTLKSGPITYVFNSKMQLHRKLKFLTSNHTADVIVLKFINMAELNIKINWDENYN